MASGHGPDQWRVGRGRLCVASIWRPWEGWNFPGAHCGSSDPGRPAGPCRSSWHRARGSFQTFLGGGSRKPPRLPSSWSAGSGGHQAHGRREGADYHPQGGGEGRAGPSLDGGLRAELAEKASLSQSLVPTGEQDEEGKQQGWEWRRRKDTGLERPHLGRPRGGEVAWHYSHFLVTIRRFGGLEMAQGLSHQWRELALAGHYLPAAGGAAFEVRWMTSPCPAYTPTLQTSKRRPVNSMTP